MEGILPGESADSGFWLEHVFMYIAYACIALAMLAAAVRWLRSYLVRRSEREREE